MDATMIRTMIFNIILLAILPLSGSTDEQQSSRLIGKETVNELNSTISQTAKLTASDSTLGDAFGASVAIADEKLVVGALFNENQSVISGSAYVFARQENNWVQTAKLTPADGTAGDRFGHAVAMSSDHVVVGAPDNKADGNDSGAAYVFARNQGSTDTWQQIAKLTSDDGMEGDQFGTAVAISNNYIVVGASLADLQDVDNGAVYVFAPNQDNTGSWQQVAKLSAENGAAHDSFGHSVAISGNTIVIGASLDDEQGDDSGAAYLFTQDQSQINVNAGWKQTAKLVANDAEAGNQFGFSVTIDEDQVLVGAFLDNDRGNRSGSAYIFARTQNTWQQVTKLTANDGAADDRFGFAVALSHKQAIIGAYENSNQSSQSGSVYVFSPSLSDANIWHQTAKLTASDATTGDAFGYSVANTAGNIIVGAQFADAKDTDTGTAYLFSATAAEPENLLFEDNFDVNTPPQ